MNSHTRFEHQVCLWGGGGGCVVFYQKLKPVQYPLTLFAKLYTVLKNALEEISDLKKHRLKT